MEKGGLGRAENKQHDLAGAAVAVVLLEGVAAILSDI